MMKKLEELRAQRTALVEKSKRAEVTDDELKTILDELRKVNESIALVEEIAKSAVDGSDEGNTGDEGDTGDGGDNSRSVQGRMKPVFNADKRNEKDDKLLAYRKAFRERVVRQIPIPQEVREAAVTTTSDVGDVIPENLISQIIDRAKDVGMVWGLVQHTNYAVGQALPQSAFRPTVSYVAEGAGSDTQKAQTTGTIQFSHYKADCRIAWTEETSRMTLEAWETYFVSKVVESITRWKENEIINGTGSANNHVTGILSQTPAFALKEDTITYAQLLELESNVPAVSEAGAKWFMAKKTFYTLFKSILDDNGQPVAGVNMGTSGKLEQVILGRQVVFIDEYIKSHNGTGTVENDITAFIYDMKDYTFNENYDLGMQRRINWDTDDHELKAVFACDGKPLYTDSLVVVKRKTTVA